MTLPIGSGFFAGDIPAKVTSKNAITNKNTQLQNDLNRSTVTHEFVKNSAQGQRAAQAYFQAANGQGQYTNTIYDQPSPQVSKAISTYTEFANLERRAEVQSMIGVDIYA